MFLRNGLMAAVAVTLMEAAASDAAAAGGSGPVGPATPNASKTKAEVETVQMEDGRSVAFAGKKRMLKEVILTEGTLPSVRFDFRNGKTRTFVVPQALLYQFAAHGASQKIGDESAGNDDVDDMVEETDDLISRLTGDPEKGIAPEWSAKREAGGFAGVSILLKALMEHSGKDEATVRAFLKPKTHGEKMALRGHPPVKAIVERLEEEKRAKAAGAAKVNAGDLLATL